MLEVVFGVLWACLGTGEAHSVHVLAGGGVVLAALTASALLGFNETGGHEARLA